MRKIRIHLDEASLHIMRIKSFVTVFIPLIGAVLLSACAIYRIDVRQGNYVDDAMLVQLKPGMTQDQVQFVLGTPLVTDVFRTNRWDYIYHFKPGRGKAQKRAISVFFVDGALDHLEGDIKPNKLFTPVKTEKVVDVPDEKKAKKRIKVLEKQEKKDK